MKHIYLLVCTVFIVCAVVGVGSALAGDGLVALQSADASCVTTAGRYVNCSNGTVSDNLTKLTWTQNADCWGAFYTWEQASIEVLNLADGFCGLTDGSSPGEWRLPTKEEWETMVAAAKELAGFCNPMLTNDAGTNCLSAGTTSFTNVASGEFGFYWSATTNSANVTQAYLIAMINGNLSPFIKTGAAVKVWAVRGGQ